MRATVTIDRVTTHEAEPTALDTLISYDVADGVAIIGLNRPGAANAIDLAMASALRDAAKRAADDSEARVVLILGAGARFCAGGDLTAMAAAADRPGFIADLAGTAHAAVRVLDGLAKPVVVGVQGSAAGIGLSLVLGADIVVAATSAKFVTAYTSVGLTPDGGMSWLLPRVVGQRRASELILTSEPLSAEAALDLGIVSRLCAPEEVAATATDVARSLATRPAHALAEARRLVRASWSRSLTEHLDDEAATITRASATPETADLISRFVGRG